MEIFIEVLKWYYIGFFVALAISIYKVYKRDKSVHVIFSAMASWLYVIVPPIVNLCIWIHSKLKRQKRIVGTMKAKWYGLAWSNGLFLMFGLHILMIAKQCRSHRIRIVLYKPIDTGIHIQYFDSGHKFKWFFGLKVYSSKGFNLYVKS